MKKILKHSLSILLVTAIILQLSCTKDNPVTPAPTYQVSGVYTGKYSVNNSSQAPLNYNLAVFPDGTIVTKGETSPGVIAYSQGTWTLTDSTFRATIVTFQTPTITQSITGTYSSTGVIKNGTWAVTASPYPFNSGTFTTLQRSN